MSPTPHKSKNLHRLAIALAAAAVSTQACHTSHQDFRDHKSSADDTQVAQAIKLFINMPAWLEAPRMPTELASSLEMLSLCTTDALRAAEVAYLSNSGDKYAKLEKLFLVNRCAFAIPSNTELKEARLFGGWLAPLSAPRLTMLWPFREMEDGSLDLFTLHSGYLGPDYTPLEEFDFLQKRFPRRTRALSVKVSL